MKEKVLHAIDIKSVYSNSGIGILLGLLLVLVPASSIVDLILVVIGLILIVTNGIRLYQRTNNEDKSSNQMLLDVLGILAGFLLISWSNLVITIIVSIYLIIEPIIELALVKFDKEKMMIEAPKIVLGVVLVICGFKAFDILFKIVGIVILLGSLLYLGINYYLYKKSGVKVIK